MRIWDTVTGSDLTRQWTAFDIRAAALPAGHRRAWEEIVDALSTYSNFTGRNLLPIADDLLELLELTAAEGQTVREVLGDDIGAFCPAVARESGARSHRDRRRARLNRTVSRKLSRLGA